MTAQLGAQCARAGVEGEHGGRPFEREEEKLHELDVCEVRDTTGAGRLARQRDRDGRECVEREGLEDAHRAIVPAAIEEK